jgi:hypothetical protein
LPFQQDPKGEPDVRLAIRQHDAHTLHSSLVSVLPSERSITEKLSGHIGHPESFSIL